MTNPVDPAAVALRIRSVVELRGTLGEAARLSGIPKPTLEGYVQGKNLPGSFALACLCRGLNVSADWILFGEGAR